MPSDDTCTGAARWSELFTQRHWAATVTLCLGVALFAFNAFLVSTALPTAVREIGGVAVIAWATSIYLALSIVGGAAAARLKVRYGARAALIASAALFLAGTLLAATASSMTEILIGRALQGIGEGIISALCYALIPELFPGRLIAKVFGAEAVVWATAAFGGPLLAGFVTETVSWRAAFLINVPVIVIFIVLVLMVVPRASAAGARVPLPFLRLAAIGGGILLVTFSAVAPSIFATSTLVLLAAALLFVAVIRDRASASPLFPTDAFSPRTVVGAGLWIVFLMPLAQASTTVYLVLTLQTLWGLGATLAGAFNACLALAWSFVAIGVASLGPATNRSGFIALGPLLLVGGLASIVAGVMIDRAAIALIGQIAIGAGFGVAWGFLSQAVMENARTGERDRAAASLPTLQSAGYAVGAAIAGLVANAAGYTVTDNDALRSAAMTVYATSAAIGLLAVGAGFLLRRKLMRAA
ncbi:MFS transporter [Bradyrhizobium sp. LHD-71]|uniref:MFS transporter n=1 Tax=Bradyrhizobium sp. LHD-71 TaxID=3072141 RepID=UPI00280C62ED|nr:MFS transporter [Bradyrhizobium sp. LHD-71]MDQ8726812.1 MFS transporter [Bradyrhizobium sp. LHD-71]